jgi:hypothetical protein
MPPMAVVTIEEKENKVAPQRLGINPPRAEPTVIPIQTRFFELMVRDEIIKFLSQKS